MEILKIHFDSLTPTENHNKKVTDVAIKKGCTHHLDSFTLEMIPAYQGAKTGLISQRVFVMCSLMVWFTCFSIDVAL